MGEIEITSEHLNDKPIVGISRCLLGENVRYNQGHKLDRYIKNTLGQFVEFVPICPEVEAGLGLPREAVQLNEINGEIKVLGINSKTDYTEKLSRWINNKTSELSKINYSGFILKSKSPSCGVFRTRLYREDKPPSLNARGLFAKSLIDEFPLLLVEEEGRLHDPIIRDNFVERMFIRHRWYKISSEPKLHKLLKFHESLKYTLMAHSPKILKEMGAYIANCKDQSIVDSYSTYYSMLKECLSIHSSHKSHKNSLDHIMGYFKKDLTHDEKSELKEVIENYYNGLVPLIVPVTLLKHYTRKYDVDYLKSQFYLNPHPLELLLRNNI